jgi:predicted transcriptional regulator
MYPAMEHWYKEKVLPGIRQSQRVAFIGYLDEQPVASAVVKKDTDAKFCHLRIDESLRDVHLGEVFFSLMALEIRDLAKNVHFTLPKSVWESKGLFFSSFGFSSAEVAETQYRLFDQELQCAGAFSCVWNSVLEKIPKLADLYAFGGFSPDSQLLMAIQPEFADRILQKKKTVEIRRRFSNRWLGHRMNLYASSPVMSLVGEARIAGIVLDKPEVIWERFQSEVGCSRAEFDVYTRGAQGVYAIEMDDIMPYRDRVPLAQISYLLNEDLTPPQSYVTLEKNRPWARAISLAACLHGCFKSTLSFCVDRGAFRGSSRAVNTPPPVAQRQVQMEFSAMP